MKAPDVRKAWVPQSGDRNIVELNEGLDRAAGMPPSSVRNAMIAYIENSEGGLSGRRSP